MNHSQSTNEFVEKLDYPTPFFLFSRDRIVKKVQEFTTHFPNANIYYAMKANFEPEVLEVIDATGIGFEFASKFELEKLVAQKVDPAKIIYGTSIKPADHISYAYDYGVRIFACDCLIELEKIAKYAPSSKVYFRLHVDNKKSVFDLSEKFGTEADEILNLIRKSVDLGLNPYGVSFHVGSQSKDAEEWARCLEQVAEIITTAEKEGITIETINIGGGYPCTYLSSDSDITLAEISEVVHTKLADLGLKQRVMMEPGRGIIAATAVAIGEVIGRAQRGNRHWLFLDLGVYNGLFEVMAYQGSTRYKCRSLRVDTTETATFALSGPTGDGPDVIDREVELPANIDVGDRIVFYDVGAYSLVAASPFNGFPKPCVHMV